MARSERRDADNRSGLGTLPRAGTRPRPQQQPAAVEQDAPDPRRGRLRAVPPQSPEAGQQGGVGRQGRGSASGAPAQSGTRPAGRRVPPQRLAGQQAADRQSEGQRPDGQRAAGPRAAARSLREDPRRRPGTPRQVPSAERVPGVRPGRATGPQPVATPSATASAATVSPAVAPPEPAPQAAARRAGVRSSVTSNRLPFVVLLCGLLGGALVSALVISTTLAAGSFQISELQSANSALAKQQQSLEAQVQQAQSPQQITDRALQLGMRRPGELRFLDLTTGKVSNDGPTWIGALNAPGYAP